MTPTIAQCDDAMTLARAQETPVEATRTDVLFVLSCLHVGGSERKIARMANRLVEDGTAVSLALLNGPYTLETTVRRDVRVHKLERRGKFSPRAAWRLRRMILRERPGTVLAVNLYQALYVACATWLMSSRPRTVALVNTSTFHGSGFVRRLYQAVLSRFDHVVHGSQAQRAFWRSGARSDERSSVIYNGVDSTVFEPTAAFEAAKRLRASLGVKPSAMLIGTVGRLAPEKNQEVLLETLQRLKLARVDAHLVIAGGGPLRERLLRRAAELEVANRVSFIGEIEDVRPVLAAIDVFVLPSTAVESFSNAALEAMAMGRPVILSDIGGAREMIDDGVEGYVVSPTELRARLPALIAALYAEPRKRQQMAQAARTRAVTCFSVSAMAAAYRALIGRGSGMSAEPTTALRPVAAAPVPAPAPSPARIATRETRVRVLQLGPDLEVRGGVSSVEQLICDFLPAYAQVRHVPTMHEGRAFARLTTFGRACTTLARALRDIEPTVVHIHFASRGSTLRKMLLAQMVIRARRPLILHAHGAGFDQFHRGLPRALRQLVNRTLQQANVLIALSSQWRDFYIRECELSPSQVTVLPNPVRVPSRVPDRAGRREVQFLHLGRLGRRKGAYDLVQAFTALPEDLRARARLVLAGDGDVEGVRQLAAPLGERVRVLPWIDPPERDRLLAESDVFVLPSYAEGMPMSLLEAMAAGVPAITTPVGGIPDVCTDGREGLLVPPGNQARLTDSLATFIRDEPARLAAGRRAHERALAFDVHAYARRLADIYQRVAPVAEARPA